ncbi:MAG: tetratricopeptide repeat protein [Proteobacteria bacterium]|nr:tetratricopeptide repeat protein [Pseudomonadota bacterium]MBU1388062.1 tetratricopeptide repeat protein [Pseudomonadota bacterium]MBU1542125.1 tetratricopeptide repeat protein [Pseudomonadota bacterium]MBU2482389.1 tetratricopeptide repeat protein [Pseudomonadota bacterium]
MKKKLFLILLICCTCSISHAESKKELFDNGVQYFKQDQYPKAIDAFSKLIEIDPDNADAYKNRGVTYMKLENFDQAIQDLEKAKSLFPELKGLYSNLGVAWYYKKDYEKAIQNYNTEIAMAPENAIVYFNRALCLTELGKDAEAIEDLSKTLELRPDFYWAICYKADILASQGKNTEAAKTYKKAIQVAPENIYAIDKLAQLEKKIQDTAIALPRNEPADLPAAPVKTENQQDFNYTLQLGAFLNRDNAQKLKIKLIASGFDCRVLPQTDAKGKTWYIVRSGGYPDKNAARKSAELLKQKLNINSIIRPHEMK